MTKPGGNANPDDVDGTAGLLTTDFVNRDLRSDDGPATDWSWLVSLEGDWWGRGERGVGDETIWRPGDEAREDAGLATALLAFEAVFRMGFFALAGISSEISIPMPWKKIDIKN